MATSKWQGWLQAFVTTVEQRPRFGGVAYRSIDKNFPTETLKFPHQARQAGSTLRCWACEDKSDEVLVPSIQYFERVTEHPAGSNLFFYPESKDQSSPEKSLLAQGVAASKRQGRLQSTVTNFIRTLRTHLPTAVLSEGGSGKPLQMTLSFLSSLTMKACSE
ncbi:bacteriocin immunity protein [Pseudomonas guariconensis]|nr:MULTISPECIES: bacteriocin immunity protein [Pseudomonas]MCO7595089.1 bacteriocin immunity protein [Pseudomonas guariconensis]MCO7631488.1 bacteriocin immunity protein [Pseudomonas guariconensis]MCU7220865.1 bacteriocin immunity protein [Pseudomonas brassicacearum]